MQTTLQKTAMRVYYCRHSAHADKLPAAVAKLGLQEDVVLEAVPCSGRLDPRYILKAFESGAQSVCIIGCPQGQCKMMEGNLRVGGRAHAAQELLEEAGMDPRALRVHVPLDDQHDTLEAVMQTISGPSVRVNGRVHEVVA